MTPAFRYFLLWVLGSTIGVLAALSAVGASFDNGTYGPANADAFYHARRILDAVFSGHRVIQFDPVIHVPEGSWLTWPWGYDQVLAWITSAFGPFSSEAQANRILMNIPPAAMPIAVGLAVLIARQLSLRLELAAIFVLGFAALPVVHLLFSVGNIDHHFAELMWTMATLGAGLSFFRPGSSPVSGIALGLVLGSAVSIHNGLFVLQFPVLLTLVLCWLRGSALPSRRHLAALGAALTMSTLLVCAFSEPWRQGFFDFATLSWFHLYAAVVVSAFALATVLVPRSPRNIALLCGAAVLAAIPVGNLLVQGAEFVSGDLDSIRSIIEARNPYALYFEYGESVTTRFVSWLMWLVIPMLLVNLWWMVRERDPVNQFTSVVLFGGLALMIFQYRFAAFGAVPMLLTPVLVARAIAQRWPGRLIESSLGCALVVAGSLYPTIESWRTKWALGGDYVYSVSRAVFPKLAPLCEREPGIVLGDLDVGHWIRYHSRCPVIANVFLLTPQHAAKANESKRLMQMTPEQLLQQAQPVRYVFASHDATLSFGRGGVESPNLEALRGQLTRLESQLLGPESEMPPEFHKEAEVLTPAGQVYSRLFRIETKR